MKVIMPVKVNPDDIVDASVIDLEPAWDASHPYSKGERVVFDGRDGPSIYQSVGEGNEGNQPDISPDDWGRYGSTRRWAPFDDSVSTAALSEDGYTCSFRVSSRFEAIALFGLRGSRVQVRIFNKSDELIFEREEDLRGNRLTTGWKSYFFGEFSPRRDVVLRNIPPFGRGLLVEVEVFGVGLTGLSEISVGMVLDFGCVEFGVTHGTRTWHRVQASPFGDELLQRVASAKRNNPQIRIPKRKHRAITGWLTDLESKVAVYIGSDDPDYEALIVHGYLEKWEILIDYPTYSLVSLNINGLK